MRVRLAAPVVLTLALVGAESVAQAPARELGQGWLSEFSLAARQLTALAEATPADRYNWRPREGVRSVSELYMHVALGNLWLLVQAGASPSPDFESMKPGMEKKVTGKADVVRWLNSSLEQVRKDYPKINQAKKVTFLGQPSTAGDVLLRVLVHNHEHMGQAIAYARVMGITPPWSARAASEK